MRRTLLLSAITLLGMSIAASAQSPAYKVGDTLPGGAKVTGIGVGPRGNPVYNTNKGMIQQSAVKPPATPAPVKPSAPQVAAKPAAPQPGRAMPVAQAKPVVSPPPVQPWSRVMNKP